MSLLGTTIGRIRLVDRLGEGGMGEVFAGYDETLERRVAVKSVHPGHRLDDKVKGRFLQEARILSRLDHPNICQIYDFVESDDRDFLVMELVEGRSLKRAAVEGLDRRQKLRIAEQVAGVLVAAHAEGVVHRDLKPEHVMITPEGEVKVLDFGIAHSLNVDLEGSGLPGAGLPGAGLPDAADIAGDETVDLVTPAPGLSSSPGSSSAPGSSPSPSHRTAAGSVVGTPRYMSPEQARGEPVTPASDMFTFGLLLQQLFTGEPPYDRQPLAKLLVAVAEGRSRPVTGLDRPLTELIEALKSPRPGRRPTAGETAERLRFIRRTPIRRLRRVAAAAAVLLVLAGVAKYTVDLRRERGAAIAARDQAEDLVTFMLEDLSRELRPVGHLDVLEQVARKALDYYEGSAAGTAGEVAFRRGQAFAAVAEVLDNQGDLEAALEAAQTAEEIHRRLAAERPERGEWQNALVLDRLELGNLYLQRGERELARQSLAGARAVAERLVELEADNVEWRRSLAEAHYGFGLFLWHEPEKAEAAFRQAISIYQRLAEDDPAELHDKYRLAVLYGQGLGQSLIDQGMEQESFAAVREAYALYEELTRADPSNSRWQFGFSWENRRLGYHLIDQGRLGEALDAFHRAREISERLLRLEPSQVDWQLGLSADHTAIGDIRERQGDLGSALESYRRALEISRRLVETDPAHSEYRQWLAIDYQRVGSVLARLGRGSEAEAAWERTVTLIDSYAGKPELLDVESHQSHAVALLHLGRVEEARPVVARLYEAGGFDEASDGELLELCRDHGLLP